MADGWVAEGGLGVSVGGRGRWGGWGSGRERGRAAEGCLLQLARPSAPFWGLESVGRRRNAAWAQQRRRSQAQPLRAVAAKGRPGLFVMRSRDLHPPRRARLILNGWLTALAPSPSWHQMLPHHPALITCYYCSHIALSTTSAPCTSPPASAHTLPLSCRRIAGASPASRLLARIHPHHSTPRPCHITSIHASRLSRAFGGAPPVSFARGRGPRPWTSASPAPLPRSTSTSPPGTPARRHKSRKTLLLPPSARLSMMRPLRRRDESSILRPLPLNAR